MIKKLVMTTCSALLLFLGLNAHASIVINTTRIIFNQEKGEALAQLTNKGDVPLLVQTWIDDGDANADPSTLQVPFSITPSIVRVDPDKGQAIRILGLNANLPQNRESLYWFNMMEIPPTPTKSVNEGENIIQIAIRTRIKLFYRPPSLKVSPTAAYDLLSFDVKQVNATYQIVVKNPSPYYINFSQLGLRLPNQTRIAAQMNDTESKIIPPYAEVTIPAPDLKSSLPANTKVFYVIINDTGGTTGGEMILPRE